MKNSSTSKILWVVTSIVIFFALLITNPIEDTHKSKIKEKFYESVKSSEPTGKWERLGWNMGMKIFENMVDTQTVRNNYIIFSTVSHKDGKTLSYGFLDMVFVNISE
jgi:hypothetical protein